MHDTTRAKKIATRLALTALVLSGLWLTFKDVDRAALLGSLDGALPFLPLVLLPQLLSLAAETHGWRRIFQLIGRPVRFGPLLGIRIATEALGRTLPAGAVVCESVKPHLLSSRCGLTVSESLAVMAARKQLVLAAHALYLGCAVVLGQAAIQSVRGLQGMGGALSLGVGAAAAVLAACAVGWSLLFRRGTLVTKIVQLLSRLPLPGAARRAERLSHMASAADATMVRVFSLPAAELAPPVAWCFLGWLLETAETVIVLHALGVHIDFATVLCIEVFVSLARHLAFVVPGGIGIQDTGYVALLALCGVPDPITVGAGVAALKRGKDAFWALVGYALLVVPASRLGGVRGAHADRVAFSGAA